MLYKHSSLGTISNNLSQEGGDKARPFLSEGAFQ